MPSFRLVSDFQPTGDQPQAIDKLVEGLERGQKRQTLLGVTGSGKTFTMANVIERVQRPTLVIAPQQDAGRPALRRVQGVLPRQRRRVLRQLLRLLPAGGLRPAAPTPTSRRTPTSTRRSTSCATPPPRRCSTRRDVIIVASVSCIYGLGEPEEYRSFVAQPEAGRDATSATSCCASWSTCSTSATTSTSRAASSACAATRWRSCPAYEELALRIEFFGDEIERIVEVDPLTGEMLDELDSVDIYPAKHFVTSPGQAARRPSRTSRRSWRSGWRSCEAQGKLLEAAAARAAHQLRPGDAAGGGLLLRRRELLAATWPAAPPGSAPWTLLDYFPEDFLLFIDESHMTLPQIRGMYDGDRARKETLVEYGFRLPSALDNRPLSFDEFEQRVNQVVYVSATPGAVRVRAQPAGGGAARPADRPARPDHRGQADQGPDRRPAGRRCKQRVDTGRARAW